MYKCSRQVTDYKEIELLFILSNDLQVIIHSQKTNCWTVMGVPINYVPLFTNVMSWLKYMIMLMSKR